MPYRTSRLGASAGPIRGRRASRDFLLSMLLIYAFCMELSPTLAKGTVFDNTKISLVRTMNGTAMSMCLKPLEGNSTFWMMLRMEVKPIGPGSNRVFLAGSVEVPSDLLEVGSEWFRLRYEYAIVNKDLVLKVWLNDAELPYAPTKAMYSGRYQFHAVKMYMMGRMEIFDGDDCPQPPTTTTEYLATIPVVVTGSHLPNPAQPAVIDEPLHPVATNPEPPAVNTPAIPVAPFVEADKSSLIWAMGAVGSVPTLIILVLVVVALLLVTIPAIILWCRKNSRKREVTNTSSKKNYDSSGCNDPLMSSHPHSTNGENSANNPQEAQFSNIDTHYNPMYRSPSSSANRPLTPPNYYSN